MTQKFQFWHLIRKTQNQNHTNWWKRMIQIIPRRDQERCDQEDARDRWCEIGLTRRRWRWGRAETEEGFSFNQSIDDLFHTKFAKAPSSILICCWLLIFLSPPPSSRRCRIWIFHDRNLSAHWETFPAKAKEPKGTNRSSLFFIFSRLSVQQKTLRLG